jgi:hypothetical protein
MELPVAIPQARAVIVHNCGPVLAVKQAVDPPLTSAGGIFDRWAVLTVE